MSIEGKKTTELVIIFTMIMSVVLSLFFSIDDCQASSECDVLFDEERNYIRENKNDVRNRHV